MSIRALSLGDYPGVLSVRRADAVLGAQAGGMADRAAQAPNTVATRFGLASGTKTFTATLILSLIGDRALSLKTPVRDILGAAKGFFRFASAAGTVLKWVGGIAGAIAAIYTGWHMLMHGGKPPGGS